MQGAKKRGRSPAQRAAGEPGSVLTVLSVGSGEADGPAERADALFVVLEASGGCGDGACNYTPVSYTHLTLPTTPYV